MALTPNEAALIRQLRAAAVKQSGQISMLLQVVGELQSRPRSVAEEIDAIEGRRMEGTLSGEVEFTEADEFNRGAPITMTVSQDGPFIQTHYPMVLWRPSAPDDTELIGRWRPVSTFPLPTQQVGDDIIDLMYEMQDGGNQRLLQNEPRGPLFSRPDNIVPCPVPTLWSPNSVIQFVPHYLRFTFDSDHPPTAGILHVDIPGYRIVNL